MGSMPAIGLIRNPCDRGPGAAVALLLLFALAGLRARLSRARPAGDRESLAGRDRFRREPRPRVAAPRRDQSPRRRRSQRGTAPVAPGGCGRRAVAADRRQRGARGERPPAAQPSLALGDNYQLADARPARRRRPRRAGRRSTAPGSSATRACSNPCSRTSTSAATSSRCARGRSSRCTSWSRRAGSRPAG